MPGFAAGMFKPGGPMAVDYLKVGELTKKLAERLKGSKEVRVFSR